MIWKRIYGYSEVKFLRESKLLTARYVWHRLLQQFVNENEIRVVVFQMGTHRGRI